MMYFVMGFKKICNFSGRSNRKEFLLFHIYNILLLILLILFEVYIFNLDAPILVIGWFLAGAIPSLSLMVRRLHDIGGSGYWVCLSMFPILNIFLIVFCAAIEGAKGDNEYGPEPS